MIGREVAIHYHGYQPPRTSYHEKFMDISSDPNGKDWTEEVNWSCYHPLTQSEYFKKMSFNMFPVTLNELERRGFESSYRFSQKGNAMVGCPEFHPILPDMNQDDIKISIRAGRESFRKITGENPIIFWSPETALSDTVLKELVRQDYKAVICAPHQIQLPDNSDADNHFVQLTLSDGSTLTAIAYDRYFSQSLGFDPKWNADEFTQHHISPRFSQTGRPIVIGCVDMEMDGHHHVNAPLFFDYLYKNSLPDAHIEPVILTDYNLSPTATGRLIERTSWSCTHNLDRWSRGCADSLSYNGWKEQYYDTFRQLNTDISIIVKNSLGPDYIPMVSQHFSDGLHGYGPPFCHDKWPLISAKANAMIGLTSCATFFDNPDTAGRINVIFGATAIQHLYDAGLHEDASRIRNVFFENLSLVNGSSGFADFVSHVQDRLYLADEAYEVGIVAPIVINAIANSQR